MRPFRTVLEAKTWARETGVDSAAFCVLVARFRVLLFGDKVQFLKGPDYGS